MNTLKRKFLFTDKSLETNKSNNGSNNYGAALSVCVPEININDYKNIYTKKRVLTDKKIRNIKLHKEIIENKEFIEDLNKMDIGSQEDINHFQKLIALDSKLIIS